MLSSRQASKELKTLVLPEVRGEVIRTQKLLTKVLCDSRAGEQTTLSTEAEASLLEVINTLFPESLSLASELIHTALNETSRRGIVYGTHATVRAAIALSARFIMSKEQGESDELSLVDPLLRHAIGCLKTHPHAEGHTRPDQPQHQRCPHGQQRPLHWLQCYELQLLRRARGGVVQLQQHAWRTARAATHLMDRCRQGALAAAPV